MSCITRSIIFPSIEQTKSTYLPWTQSCIREIIYIFFIRNLVHGPNCFRINLANWSIRRRHPVRSNWRRSKRWRNLCSFLLTFMSLSHSYYVYYVPRVHCNLYHDCSINHPRLSNRSKNPSPIDCFFLVDPRFIQFKKDGAFSAPKINCTFSACTNTILNKSCTYWTKIW